MVIAIGNVLYLSSRLLFGSFFVLWIWLRSSESPPARRPRPPGPPADRLARRTSRPVSSPKNLAGSSTCPLNLHPRPPGPPGKQLPLRTLCVGLSPEKLAGVLQWYSESTPSPPGPPRKQLPGRTLHMCLSPKNMLLRPSMSSTWPPLCLCVFCPLCIFLPIFHVPETCVSHRSALSSFVVCSPIIPSSPWPTQVTVHLSESSKTTAITLL